MCYVHYGGRFDLHPAGVEGRERNVSQLREPPGVVQTRAIDHSQALATLRLRVAFCHRVRHRSSTLRIQRPEEQDRALVRVADAHRNTSVDSHESLALDGRNIAAGAV